MTLAGHAVFWIVFVLLGLICFMRAFGLREIGYNDDGRTRDRVKENVMQLWAWLAAGFIFLALVDMLSFFRIMPDY